MAERDRASVHVHDRLVDAEHPGRVARDGRERLVDLDRLTSAVVGRPPPGRALPPWRVFARGRRSRPRPSRARGSWRGSRDRAARAYSSEQTTTHEAPSLTPGALPAVVVPSGSKTGFSAASCSGEVSRRMLSSRSSSPAGTISSANLPASSAAAARGVGPCRPGVLGLAGDAELARDARRLHDHVIAVERRRETVEDHVVEELAVAEPVAEARLREQVGRVRHRLHPAGDDDVVEAGADHQVGDLDRADRRRAHLVDRVGGNLLRDPRADRRLPGGRLAGAGLQHLAHDDVADLCRVEPARSSPAAIAIEPSSVGRNAGEPAAEPPERGANGETITERVTPRRVAGRARGERRQPRPAPRPGATRRRPRRGTPPPSRDP